VVQKFNNMLSYRISDRSVKMPWRHLTEGQSALGLQLRQD